MSSHLRPPHDALVREDLHALSGHGDQHPDEDEAAALQDGRDSDGKGDKYIHRIVWKHDGLIQTRLPPSTTVSPFRRRFANKLHQLSAEMLLLAVAVRPRSTRGTHPHPEALLQPGTASKQLSSFLAQGHGLPMSRTPCRLFDAYC